MSQHQERMHALDAVRGFALLLGVVFHATMSFMPGLPPGIWAINDNSPSEFLGTFGFVAHAFRMSLFFFIAGFFAHLVFHRKGASRFWSNRSKRILVPMIIAWMILLPAVFAVWAWGRSVQFPGVSVPQPSLSDAPAGWFPLLHLWFLYYLMMFYVAVVGVRSAIVYFDRKFIVRNLVDKAIQKVVARFWFGPLLGLPVAGALASITFWSPLMGIPTPDQSLLPQWPAVLGFGSAFVFGWLLHRQTELLKVWEQRWLSYLAAALAFTLLALLMISPGAAINFFDSTLARFGGALVYALMIWTWIFAITGAALKFLNKESALIRYVADSSYWIYLAHLPIVAALQVAVGTLPLHWSIKLPMILVVSFAVLFGSYYLFVRSTFIGQLLNGRKYSRGLSRHTDKLVDASESRVLQESQGSNVLARLQDVHKTFGKTAALQGVNLEVKRGELLALLGSNGAGKSTAINVWLGLQQANAGTVELMGGSPSELDRRRAVGVMMQELKMETVLKVRELVNLSASNYPDPMSPDEAMALTHTAALANKQYSKLSVGQRRQVQIAMAICGRPQLLFLDEPTVGLDVQAREALWQCIRNLLKQNCAIVLTTHYLEEAETLANRVAVLAHGKMIASGTVAEIRGLVSRKKITCSSSVTQEQIRTWPEVIDVNVENDKFLITARNAEAVVRRLLQEDASLHNLEVKQAGLADAFVELVKEAA